jgi:hypothetical protein
MTRRLVLLVEGQGDADAAPVLVKKLLTEQHAWDAVVLDPHPLRVGDFSKLVKNDFAPWRRFLGAAGKRPNVGGCLLLLDGDSRGKFESVPFCAARGAQRLVEYARIVGAGTNFSLAVVFACMEFETWLLAGVESLAGRKLPDGRNGVQPDARPPDGDLETAPRDAKGWLNRLIKGGYNQTRDQADLTDMVDLNMVRQRELRSFRRLENAIGQIVAAIRTGNHTATPFVPTTDSQSM